MKFVFLMDNPEGFDYSKDTSFVLIQSALNHGHEVYYLPQNGLSLHLGDVQMQCYPIISAKPQIDLGDLIQLYAHEVARVFIRLDPPFDASYLMSTWILDHCPPTCLVINSAQGIRTVNEKVWAMQFLDLVPPTLLTASRCQFTPFLNHHKKIVMKPANGFGGQGILIVSAGDLNANSMFELLSDNETCPVVLQRYVSESDQGDKRILLLDAEPLGALLRVHSSTDHRNNLVAGGLAQQVDITSRDLDIIAVLQPQLLDLGLFFVGIDIIGDYLIEVNVTSPTGLQEISRFDETNYADRVIVAAIEKSVSVP